MNIQKIISEAKYKGVWSAENGKFLKLDNNNIVRTLFLSDSKNEIKINIENEGWYNTLFELIDLISFQISSEILLKGNIEKYENIIIVSNKIASFFKTFSSFTAIENADESTNGIKIGILNSKYTIYENSLIASDLIIISKEGLLEYRPEYFGVIVFFDL